MAISQADLKTISTVFGKNVDEISGALSSEEEVSLDLRLSGKILTDEQQKELRESGVQQGKELGTKGIAKALGLELDSGEKEPEKVAEKLKLTLTSQIEEKYKNPDPTKEQIALEKKAAEWEDKYKTLYNTYEETKGSLEEWQTKYQEKEKAIKQETRNSRILKSLPKELNINREDAMLIVNNVLKFDETDDGTEIIRNGSKTYKTPVGEPEPLENVVKLFAEERGWISKGDGMGGGDRKPANNNKKGMTPDEAFKYIKEKGIEPGSADGLKMFRELTSK